MSLVILPCHSIWKGGEGYGDSADEWHLVDFQLEGKDHLCFKDHIIQSIQYLRDHPESYLIISGGQTKHEAGPISESLSYYQLARKLISTGNSGPGALSDPSSCPSLLDRITTEEFARDSFENVVFLICRYYERFQRYPESITVIGFEFKRARFLSHHLNQAMKFPLQKLSYIGNSPNPGPNANYFKDLHESEYKFALRHFQDDWYGKGPQLLKKKLARNPFNRFHGYKDSNPKLSQFLVAIDDLGNGQNDLIRFLNEMPWIEEEI